jgi:hypothetical protein
MFPWFPLGQIVATPGTVAALERAKQPPTCFLARHAIGDWGEREPTDVAENEYSVAHGLFVNPRFPPTIRASPTTSQARGRPPKPLRDVLVGALKSPREAMARPVPLTDHVVATWFDLSNLKLGPTALRFISLFDDTLDVWASEDFRLVAELSEIVRWSNPDDLADKIAA